jgi:predicted MPP superfamily phosphohydrolase
MHRLTRRRFLFVGTLGLSALGAKTVGQTASPPPASPARSAPLLRVAALGDVGAGDKNQRAVGEAIFREHRRDRLSRVLLLGDNIYNQGEIEKVGEAFEKPYAELLKQNVPFSACLGNHDIRSANGEGQLRYARYGIKGRYYTFEEKGVAFFVLDTNSNTDWVKQLSWLEGSLKASKARWKIAYGHHPIYSSGHYGNSPEFIRTLTPLFKRYGVALYLNGHEHHYERSKPIDGTTYLVAGIGGASLRKVVRSEQTAFADSLFGFSTLSIYSDRLAIQGINTKNQVFDRGVIRPIG